MSAQSRRRWRLIYRRSLQATAFAVCIAWVALIFQLGGSAVHLMHPSAVQVAEVRQ